MAAVSLRGTFVELDPDRKWLIRRIRISGELLLVWLRKVFCLNDRIFELAESLRRWSLRLGVGSRSGLESLNLRLWKTSLKKEKEMSEFLIWRVSGVSEAGFIDGLDID